MTPTPCQREKRTVSSEAKRRVLRDLRLELAGYGPFGTANAREKAECEESQRLLRLAIRAVLEASEP